MTDLAVPIPSVDELHAHFVEWVWYLDAKEVEFTTQQAKLDAKKGKTRTATHARLSPAELTETTRGVDFLDRVFQAQTRSELEITASQAQVEHAPDDVTSEDDLAQVTEDFELPKVEAHGSGVIVTSPMVSPVDDDELT